MTTAHRATWKAARGGLHEEGSFRLHVPSAAVSAKDAPTERNLKLRADAHGASSREALRAALGEGENPVQHPPKRRRFALLDAPKLEVGNRNPDAIPDELKQISELDRDAELDEGESSDEEVELTNKPGEKARDNDNKGDDGGSGDDSSAGESDDDDDDDDEAELLAELERIRKEREFEKAKKQAEEQERLEREETERVAIGNPLLGNLFNDEISDTASIATGSMPAFAVKRRWDDDVVFRGQSKGERKVTPRFINDTIRNDFHRKFMKRYMR